MSNGRVSIFLQRSCSAARKTVEGGRETLHFLCNNGFRVVMLDFFWGEGGVRGGGVVVFLIYMSALYFVGFQDKGFRVSGV